VGLSGINIGGGCSSTIGNFAFGIGDNAIANSNGLSLAIALGNAEADSTGILTAALAAGTGTAAFTNGIVDLAAVVGTNVAAQAGNRAADFANLAFNFGNAESPVGPPGVPPGPSTSVVDAGFGGFNLAANLGGNANSQDGIPFDMVVVASGAADPVTGAVSPGFGNLALNLLGNRNDIEAFGGFLNAAINLGNLLFFPNGSNTTIHVGEFTGDNAGPSNLSVGFNWQPALITPPCEGLCGNNVLVQHGLGSLAAAIGVVDQTVLRTGFGISINGLSIPANSAAVLAAPSVKSSPGVNGSNVSKSASSAGSALKSVSNKITTSAKNVSATVNNTVKKVTTGLAAGTKGGAAATAGVKKGAKGGGK
jgi:hypothetical protein